MQSMARHLFINVPEIFNIFIWWVLCLSFFFAAATKRWNGLSKESIKSRFDLIQAGHIKAIMYFQPVNSATDDAHFLKFLQVPGDRGPANGKIIGDIPGPDFLFLCQQLYDSNAGRVGEYLPDTGKVLLIRRKFIKLIVGHKSYV
jgi:hypothetical protein